MANDSCSAVFQSVAESIGGHQNGKEVVQVKRSLRTFITVFKEVDIRTHHILLPLELRRMEQVSR